MQVSGFFVAKKRKIVGKSRISKVPDVGMAHAF